MNSNHFTSIKAWKRFRPRKVSYLCRNCADKCKNAPSFGYIDLCDNCMQQPLRID